MALLKVHLHIQSYIYIDRHMKLKILLRMIGKKTKEGAGDINTQDKFIKTYKLLDLEKEYKFVLIMGYSFQMEKEMKT